MAAFLFPDNTVLCNFAAVGRSDLLRTFLGEKGRWVEAVAAEASNSAAFLPDLERLISGGWLGDPIEVTDPDHIHRIDVIRRDRFGGRRNQPLKHLGEAQTCFVIHEIEEWKGSSWISDDRDALEFARFQNLPTMETIDIMRHLVASYDVTGLGAFDIMQAMAAADRALRMPAGADDLSR